MKPIVTTLLAMLIGAAHASAQNERLMYHQIKTDASGHIIPWNDPEPGKAYDEVIRLVWNFWDHMRRDINGLPYYMNHQVWQEGVNDQRGLGGDQLQMALSSWRLLYAYSGNEQVKENMRFLADYYITHGFSPANCKWPNIPFPYNTLVYSGRYDGDMVIGKDYSQPDKAGSLALELVHLYKMTSKERYPNKTNEYYLDVAMGIANTLADKMMAGDYHRSPLPFKVNVMTGELGVLDHRKAKEASNLSAYTSNWSATLELFLDLIHLKKGRTEQYQKAFDMLLKWMKTYPLKNNRWGPFFEDIPGWSDTQINAITFAQFMMNHRQFFPNWQQEVKQIFTWVYEHLGNKKWEKYGVVVINEQTVYQTPGNSHTSRQASAELQYVSLTRDSSFVPNAVRQLNWATYMVDSEGRNRYPQDDHWLTDGYGDYVRHYLRAMGVMPELAPSGQDHLLRSSATVQQADYPGGFHKFITMEVKPADTLQARVYYRSFETNGTDVLRLSAKPGKVFVNEKEISADDTATNYYSWKPLGAGGVLTITRKNGVKVLITD